MRLTFNKYILYYHVVYTLIHGSPYMSHPQGERTQRLRDIYKYRNTLLSNIWNISTGYCSKMSVL